MTAYMIITTAIIGIIVIAATYFYFTRPKTSEKSTPPASPSLSSTEAPSKSKVKRVDITAKASNVRRGSDSADGHTPHSSLIRSLRGHQDDVTGVAAMSRHVVTISRD